MPLFYLFHSKRCAASATGTRATGSGNYSSSLMDKASVANCEQLVPDSEQEASMVELACANAILEAWETCITHGAIDVHTTRRVQLAMDAVRAIAEGWHAMSDEQCAMLSAQVVYYLTGSVPLAVEAYNNPSFGPKKAQKGQGKGKGTTSQYVKKVDLYKLPTKWFLRAYADESGNMLMTQGAKPSKYFTADAVRNMLDGDCSELARRPGMGFNLAACTMEAGLDVLEPLRAVLEEGSDESLAALKKTGIFQILEWLQSDENKLMEHVSYLNISNEQNRSIDETKDHALGLIKLLGDKESSEKIMKMFAKLADSSSRLYGLSIAGMEFTALATKLKVWAKKVPEIDKQDGSVRRWAKEPENPKLLAKAVGAYYQERSARPKKKKGFGGSDD
jgi:hypothetical protein